MQQLLLLLIWIEVVVFVVVVSGGFLPLMASGGQLGQDKESHEEDCGEWEWPSSGDR